MVSDYTTTASFAGPAEPVLAAALATLTGSGFRIVDRTATGAVLTGPGLNSTRENPLLGASRVELAVEGATLRVRADLGGVASMRRLLVWLPLGLGLGLGLLFTVVGGLGFGRQSGVGFGVPWAPGGWWWVPGMAAGLLPVSPWVVLTPLMIRMVRRRTQRALDVLASNAVFAGRPA